MLNQKKTRIKKGGSHHKDAWAWASRCSWTSPDTWKQGDDGRWGTSAAIICTASNAADLTCGRWLRWAGVWFLKCTRWGRKWITKQTNRRSRPNRRDGAEAEPWGGVLFPFYCVQSTEAKSLLYGKTLLRRNSPGCFTASSFRLAMQNSRAWIFPQTAGLHAGEPGISSVQLSVLSVPTCRLFLPFPGNPSAQTWTWTGTPPVFEWMS